MLLYIVISLWPYYRDYEWFKFELPAYLFPSPADQDASIVDVDVVREVCDVSDPVIVINPFPHLDKTYGKSFLIRVTLSIAVKNIVVK